MSHHISRAVASILIPEEEQQEHNWTGETYVFSPLSNKVFFIEQCECDPFTPFNITFLTRPLADATINNVPF